MSLDKALSEVLRIGLTPSLKERGFRKSGASFLRTEGRLTWILAIQKSRWNSLEEGLFTLNCGVYFPGLQGLYANKKEAGNPRIEDCAVYARSEELV